MRHKVSIAALIVAFLVVSAWAAHHTSFIGFLKRLHGGQ
jgi:hypothetical protein